MGSCGFQIVLSISHSTSWKTEGSQSRSVEIWLIQQRTHTTLTFCLITIVAYYISPTPWSIRMMVGTRWQDWLSCGLFYHISLTESFAKGVSFIGSQIFIQKTFLLTMIECQNGGWSRVGVFLARGNAVSSVLANRSFHRRSNRREPRSLQGGVWRIREHFWRRGEIIPPYQQSPFIQDKPDEKRLAKRKLLVLHRPV